MTTVLACHLHMAPLGGPDHIARRMREKRQPSRELPDEAVEAAPSPAPASDKAAVKPQKHAGLEPDVTLPAQQRAAIRGAWQRTGMSGFELGEALLDMEEQPGWKSQITPSFYRYLEHEGLHPPTARSWMKIARVLGRMLQPEESLYLQLCGASQGALHMLAGLLEDFPGMLLAASGQMQEEDLPRLWEGEQEWMESREQALDAIHGCTLPDPEFRMHITQARDRWMIEGRMLSIAAQGRLKAQALAKWQHAVQRRLRLMHSEGAAMQVRKEMEAALEQRARLRVQMNVNRLLRQYASLSLEERQMFYLAARNLPAGQKPGKESRQP